MTPLPQKRPTPFTQARHDLLLDLLAVAELFPEAVPDRMARDLRIAPRRLLACLRQARAIRRRLRNGLPPLGSSFALDRPRLRPYRQEP